MNTDNFMKTGTTTVGLVAKDCVILAADKRATAGNYIADKNTEKVVPISDNMALTTAGGVSDIQLHVKVIRAELALKNIRAGRQTLVKEGANLAAGMVYANIRRMSMVPGIVHFLFAGYDRDGGQLYDIYPDGSISLIDKFVASGSGSMFAMGVLESQYTEGLNQDKAVELAIKAVSTAVKRDSASGEGVDVYVIDKDGVRQVTSQKL